MSASRYGFMISSSLLAEVMVSTAGGQTSSRPALAAGLPRAFGAAVILVVVAALVAGFWVRRDG